MSDSRDGGTPAAGDPARLEAVARSGLLDTAPEPAFDRLTRLAAAILDAPIALVSLVDRDRQFFKSCYGLAEPLASQRETPISYSFCRYAVDSGEPLVIDDATLHPLVRDNPATAELGVRAYAGIPLRDGTGYILGTLCVLDSKPRSWTSRDVQVLTDLAGSVMTELALREEAEQRTRAERQHVALLEALEVERARLGRLFEQAPAFIAAARGPDHVFEMANTAYYQLVGFRELVGMPVAEALPEVVSQGLVAKLDEVMATGTPFVANEMPILLQREPGGPLEKRFVSFVYQPLVEADGSRSGIFCHGIDVTAQVTAAAKVRDAEERYRLLVERSPDGIVVHQQGRLVFANQAAARLARAASFAELVGRSMLDFVHPDYHAAVLARVAGMAEGHEFPVAEQRWLRLDGTSVDVEVSSMPFTFQGEPAVQSVFRDITERRELEEQLRQSQKMDAIGRLAGGISHDFNNLLTVIRAHSEFLLEDIGRDDPRRADAKQIQAAADRAAALTRQLLAFSRKQILASRPTDVNGVILNLQPMLRRLIGEDIVLDAKLHDAIGTVMADAGQLEQVLVNLIVNARDAMPHGGRIHIETANVVLDEQVAGARHAGKDRPVVLGGQYVMMSVSDTGTGIPATIRDHIFDPFFTTKEPGKGTGLGLSTVYGIIKQSGGHVWVYSEPEQGSTFKVYLPRLGDAAASYVSGVAAAVVVPRGTETVLLVEDEESVRELARRVLERQGYTVLEARNGRQALEAAAQHAGVIHLILTDVVMPGMSGRGLVERLTAVRPAVQVIYMSGYTDDDIVRRGIVGSGVAFVQKPFAAPALLQVVRNVLDGTTGEGRGAG